MTVRSCSVLAEVVFPVVTWRKGGEVTVTVFATPTHLCKQYAVVVTRTVNVCAGSFEDVIGSGEKVDNILPHSWNYLSETAVSLDWGIPVQRGDKASSLAVCSCIGDDFVVHVSALTL